MKFLTNKIELICSTDTTRENLCSPYLDLSDPKNPYLVATDGHRLVALHLTADQLHDGSTEHKAGGWTDVSGWIPLDAIKSARKLKSWIDASKPESVRVIGGATYPRLDASFQFPDWRQVCPRDDRPEIETRFSAKYLKDAADVLEEKAPVVYYGAEDFASPARVVASTVNPRHIACIMPTRYGNAAESPAVRCSIVLPGDAVAKSSGIAAARACYTKFEKEAAQGKARILELEETTFKLNGEIGTLRKANAALEANAQKAQAAIAMHAGCAGMLKSALERAEQTPEGLEETIVDLKDEVADLKKELAEAQKEADSAREEYTTLETKEENERELRIGLEGTLEDAERAATLRLEQVRLYLKAKVPPAWCDCCDTAGYRHTPDCLILAVLPS